MQYDHSLHPPFPQGDGEGRVEAFSEGLYRRDIGQIGVLGENWHSRRIGVFCIGWT